jgi:hypothetical protein
MSDKDVPADSDLMDLGDIAKKADPGPEIQSLRAERDKLKKELRRQQVAYGDLQGYFTDLKSAVEPVALPEQPIIYRRSCGDKVVESPVTAVMHWTDWHMGMVQEAEEIEGISSFSPEILEHRILDLLVPEFIEWVGLHRHSYRVDHLAILDTGDNISGDIHDELRITNAFPTPVQAVRAAELKAKAISLLAPHFEKITVHFIVDDNHGRLTQKPQCKQGGMNTHNYTVGYLFGVLCKNMTNVDIRLYPMHQKVVNVADQRYLITHGHGIRGWAGIPFYGIERKVGKESKVRLHDPIERRFTKIVQGHFHVSLFSDWYTISPSVSGTDAYDHKNGRRAQPGQSGWFVHPRRGEFDHTLFQLDDDAGSSTETIDVLDNEYNTSPT